MQERVVDAIIFWREVAPLIIGGVCLIVLAVSAVVAAVMRIVRRIRSNGG